MARKSYKQLLIEKYPYLENYINEQWQFYKNENESFVGIQTNENIADNIEIDIYNCGLDDINEAQRQGLI